MEEFKLPGEENNGGELPVKLGGWARVKAFFLQEIKVQLTPAQQEFEDRLNTALNQPVTFKSFKDFLFQEIKF